MSPARRSDILAALLGLAVGAGVAAWLASRSANPRPTATSTVHEAQTTRTPVVTSRPSSEVSPASGPDRIAALLAAGADKRPLWQTLAAVEMPGDKAAKWIRMPELRAKGPPMPPSPLNPEFAAFFGLNAAEQAAIVAELDAVIAQQAELDLGAAEPLPIAAGQSFLSKYETALRIAPYPEAGAALHDSLHAKLAATLGAERMAVYENWSSTKLLADWQGLGLSERTIHVKRQNPGTPYQRWDINYEASTPDGDRRQFNSAGNTLEEADQWAGFPLSRWLEAHPLKDTPAQ